MSTENTGAPRAIQCIMEELRHQGRIEMNDRAVSRLERYQQSGLREDSFAEPTTRYQDFPGALHCMIQDCGFQFPANHQSGLFDTEGAP